MTRMEKLVRNNIENSYDTDIKTKEDFLSFVDKYKTSFFCRDNKNGHITSSMLVLNESKDKVLLTHHKKFNLWLQLGGHNDTPGLAPLGTAVKEMFEEGFGDNPVTYNLLLPDPLDIDAHKAGDHFHYDMCFICVVSEENKVECSFESNDVGWKSIESIMSDNSDMYGHRLKRLLNKAMQLENKNDNTKRVNKKIS